MKKIVSFTFALFMLSYSFTAQAVTVEAEGRALIRNQEINTARQEALQDASQQALIQAGAYVSSTQTVTQGVLSVDNLQIRSLGKLSDVQIVDEKVQGQLFILKIRAEVRTDDNSCQQASQSAGYLKSAAVTAFPIERPTEANLGDLHNASQSISKILSDRISSLGNLRAMNASHFSVNPLLATATASQQAQGPITELLPNFKDLDVQFIISGVIRELRRFDPSQNSEGNLFKNAYNTLDYRGQQHMRNFAMDVFVHDGFTGALIFNNSYRVGGLWALSDHTKTGFGTAAFLKTDYGQKINTLILDIGDELDKQLKCEPFRARIINARGTNITFNAGAITGIRPGDKLTVYRKYTFYDQQQIPHMRLENTQQTLFVNEVHSLFSVGRISTDTMQKNIQQDDILLAW